MSSLTITSSRWQSLRKQSQGIGMLAEPVDPLIPQCLIGVDEDGHLHLMIAIGDDAVKLPPELEAVVVQVIDANGNYLDVYAKAHYEMIFTPIVNQIFAGVAVQGRKPIDAVVQTIEEFRGALRPLKPDLSLAEQIGLFGELWVLQNVLIPSIGPRACYLWSGPDSERHDFMGAAVHIEVKSTTRSEDRHEISRIDQLRAPAGKKLLLASIQLERSEGGEKTLVNLIDEITASLGLDGKAVDAFEMRLAKMGWHDGLRQSGALRRFNLRDALFFDVEGSFPRLPDDYVPPRGIVAIRYTIDVSSRSVVDRDEIDGLVKLM
ncbi:PD-(D/E)XK motif protein [Rugamonas rivuli]|nr:PD-(D/E)XK motif protein [Rugamonas rivuli]